MENPPSEPLAVPEAPSKGRTPGWRSGVLYLLLVVAGVFAALQARRFFHMERPPGRITLRASTWTEREFRVPNPPGGLVEMLETPGGLAGIVPMERDPGGITPPAGAQRLWAHRLPRGVVTIETARYRVEGSIEGVISEFTACMTRAGYEAIGRSEPDGGGRTGLSFQRLNDRAIVTLRIDGKDAKIATAWVMVILSGPKISD